jgi:hypothetical protein
MFNEWDPLTFKTTNPSFMFNRYDVAQEIQNVDYVALIET